MIRNVELSLPTNAAIPSNLGIRRDSSIDTNLRVFNPEQRISELEARFPQIFELFERVGIHPTRSDKPHNPYTGTNAEESFTNIGEHCVAVAYAASKILDALVKARVAQSEDADLVTERALVHDITKPYEIMRRDARRAGLQEEVYSVSAYEKLRPILTEMGISEDLAEYLVNAGTETGHNSLQDFIEVDASGLQGVVPGKVAQKIVHLADDMTFTSTPSKEGEKPITLFLTPWERMLASSFVEKYPWLWKEGLGVNDSGKIIKVDDINSVDQSITPIGDYAALQVAVAGGICREFQLFIDPASTETPEAFIKAIINSV